MPASSSKSRAVGAVCHRVPHWAVCLSKAIGRNGQLPSKTSTEQPALEERADDYFSLDELESKNLLASLIHLSSVLHWKEWELELHQYFQSPFMLCFLGSEVIHLATVDLSDFLQICVRFRRKNTRAMRYLAPTDLL